MSKLCTICYWKNLRHEILIRNEIVEVCDIDQDEHDPDHIVLLKVKDHCNQFLDENDPLIQETIDDRKYYLETGNLPSKRRNNGIRNY